MAFMKKANFIFENVKIEALNIPDWEEYNLSTIKVASVQKDTKVELGGFNLQAAVKQNPDHLFVKVLAIVKDEINDNADAFPEAVLRKAAKTFIGVPVFCNHQNDDIEKARGKVVHAWYDDEVGGIYVISSVDRIAYPELARGIEEGYIAGTSMGCSVGYALCSVCHNKAATADEYCDHIKNRKNRKFSGKSGCKYHQSSCEPSDSCPICGDIKTASNEWDLKDHRIHEVNYDVGFIEDSFVVNPACKTCLVQHVFNPSGLSRKVASLKEKVIKLSSVQKNIENNSNNGFIKEAGLVEIEFLTDAMEKIEKVAKSMMAQKKYVSMEYVSSLVDALASVQQIADELIEMGYGQLPSAISKEGNLSSANSAVSVQPQMAAIAPVPSPAKMPINTNSGAGMENIGDIGSVTKPKTSSVNENSDEKKKEFVKVFGKLNERLNAFAQILSELSDNKQEQEIKESTVMSNKNSQGQAPIERTAAHDTSVVTEKQLDNAKFTGERQGDAPSVITEKQLEKPKDVNVTTSETPQKRQDSPDVITEKQLEKIKSGYVVRWNDAPDVITEGQWDKTSRMIGSMIEEQGSIITEKQLESFLSKHSYEDINVITEKQLDKDKSEIVKRWADSKEIVKTAMNVLADTIAYFGKTPSEIQKAATYLTQNARTADKAAYLVLVNALPAKAEARRSEREKFNYFSKLASSSVNTVDTVDALLVNTADQLGGFSADDILSAMKVISANSKGIAQVEKLAKERLSTGPKIEKVVDKIAEFQSAIEDLSAPEDGVYKIYADLDEIGVKPTDKKAFVKAVTKFANTQINDNSVSAVLTHIDLDTDNKVVVATVKDQTKLTADEKKAVAQAMDWLDGNGELGVNDLGGIAVEDENASDPAVGVANEDEGTGDDLMDILGEDESLTKPMTAPQQAQPQQQVQPQQAVAPQVQPQQQQQKPVVASRKQNRENLVKTAQMFGGEMGGQGGAAQAPGAGATMPTPPAGGAAPGGQPPLESFENSDAGADLAGEGDEQGDLKIVPPGTRCVMCGSDDVDSIKGTWKCNHCGSEGTVDISVRVTKAPGIIGDKDTEKKDEAGPGGEGGFALPEEDNAPTAPTTASSDKVIKTAGEIEVDAYGYTFLYRPEAVKKAAEAKVKPFSVSPITNSTNTVDLGNGKHLCLDSGIAYNVRFAFAKDNPKKVYANVTWNNPEKLVVANCDTCSRSKAGFVKALKSLSYTEAQFDAMSDKEQGKVILAMKNKGLLNQIKTASVKSGSLVNNFKNVLASVDEKSFPVEACRQKLANRFGENAVCLSGPCEGKPLFDCVCKALKKAGVYSPTLAIKVAEIWAEKDAIEECKEDYIREGFEYKEACTICDTMKTKYAQVDDELAEEIGGGLSGETPTDPTDPTGSKAPQGPEETGETVDGLSEVVENDPFSGGEATGTTISVELPIDLVEKLDAAIDVAKGENPAEEAHHQEALPNVDVSVEIPSDAAEAVDQAADKVLDENLGGEASVTEGGEVAPSSSEVVPSEEKPMDGGGEVSEMKAPSTPVAVVEEVVQKIEGEASDVENEESEKSEKKKEGNSEDTDNDNKNDNPGVMNKDEDKTEVEKEGTEKDNGEEMDSIENIEKEANSMKSGFIGRTGRFSSSMDLSGVLAVVTKKADKEEAKSGSHTSSQEHQKSERDIGSPKEKSLEQQNVQDSKDIGKYEDGKTMGVEEKLEKKGPEVPTGNALIGEEKEIKEHDLKVPAGSKPMGIEEQEGGDVRVTGGEQGAGNSKSASTKERLSNLADRILAAKKTASDKKLEEAKPVSEDKDIKPISGDSTIGKEEKFDAKEVNKGDVKSSGGHIGNEKETLGDKPDAPKDQPSIPAGGGKFKNEENSAEKQTKDKGTVIAESQDVKKVAERATTIAGRMLTAGSITLEQLPVKIEELKSYKLAQLDDLEKALFAPKGFTTASGGLEQAPVIREESNQRSAKAEVTNKLASLFTLTRQNEMAQETDSAFKKTFNK